MALEAKVSVTEEFTNFYYTAAQEGILLRSQYVTNITKAYVAEVGGQAAGNIQLHGQISAVNIQTGTVGSDDPTTNGMQLFLYSSATGTIVEESSGTITENLKIHIEGY